MHKKILANLLTIIIIISLIIFMGCIEEEMPEVKPQVQNIDQDSTQIETPIPTQEPKTENLLLGTTVTYDDIDFTTLRYDITNSYEWSVSGYNYITEAPQGIKYLWMYVTATNNAEDSEYLPDSYGMVILYNSQQIEPTFIMKDEGKYEGGKVYPGITRNGWVLFEIPSNANANEIIFLVDFGLFTDKIATWDLSK
jgi:hypothetical protein